MKKALVAILLFILVCVGILVSDSGLSPAQAASGAVVDPALEATLAARLGAVPAVITYAQRPDATDLGRLRTLGITKGIAMRELPMVIADVNRTQLAALRSQPGVRSVWGNQMMQNFLNESRRFIGVPQMMADTEVTRANANNPGMPVSGRGIGIGYIDTGIDATQPDLEYGRKTAQNVQQPLANLVVSDAGLVLGVGVSVADLVAGTGFVPPIYVENVRTSDIESGHGTHGAGVAAGTGANSGGFYAGVAPGAHLVGVQSGDDKGLPLVAILGAFDYLLANQYQYNIRVINNSWGSRLSAAGINPANPINVASRTAHDRNIVVVFAAGNAGDTATSINPYSTMPWTISVAAGEKQGLGAPASFSSRGVDNGTGTDTTSQPADPNAPPNLRPDITAPGLAVISVRAHGASPLMTASGALLGDAQNIPPAFIPNYMTSQGTSFAAPHVSGVVALMLEANPTLTPAQVLTILRETANPMPYDERVVGAGYADAHNAVRAALSLSAVPHPFNLFPEPGGPQMTDAADDQLGTTAQDIRAGEFAYDAAARQIVYTLTLADLSVRTPNMRWTMTSSFGTTEVFVTASTDELGTSYRYGKIEILATGTRQQTNLGAADSGAINGNQITIRLSVDKVNAAVGADVVGTTSTNTQAQAQILIGASVSGGLLLNADSATGGDFHVGEQGAPDAGPTPEATPEPAPDQTPDPAPESDPAPEASQAGKFDERYSGALVVGQSSVEMPFVVRRSALDARITSHPGNQAVIMQLVNGDGQVVADADNGRIQLSGLAPGNYTYRVGGSVIRSADFTIKSTQGR